jgi:Domain of unknown function (DUF6915)
MLAPATGQDQMATPAPHRRARTPGRWMGVRMNSWYHAKASARKWGGEPQDYLPIHEFIDSSKKVIGDVRHRSLYHHTLGVWLCQEVYGPALTVGRKQVPVRLIAERHVIEDLGWLPSPADYLDGMPIKPWMSGRTTVSLPLSTLNLTGEPA